jgi:hypothetical protein
VGEDGYYTPSDQGYEPEIADRLRKWWADSKTDDGRRKPPGPTRR